MGEIQTIWRAIGDHFLSQAAFADLSLGLAALTWFSTKNFGGKELPKNEITQFHVIGKIFFSIGYYLKLNISSLSL